jgi:uncharacterized Zn-finger protein
MSSNSSFPGTAIQLVCMKTVSSEKLEWGGVVKVKSHPTFTIDIEFGDSKKKKTFTCPYCKKNVKYKAYRFIFSLKKALIWPTIVTGLSILLFSIAIFLYGFGGWSIDNAMYYFGIWGIVGFVLGVIFLIVQVLRYLIFYRTNKRKYVFQINAMMSNHVTTENTLKASWRKLPIPASKP